MNRIRKRRISKEELKDEVDYKFSVLNDVDRKRLIGIDKSMYLFASISTTVVLIVLALMIVGIGLLIKNAENKQAFIIIGSALCGTALCYFIVTFSAYFKSDDQRVKRQLKKLILKTLRFENERKKVYDDTDIQKVTLVKSFVKLKTFPKYEQERFAEFKVEYVYGVTKIVVEKEDTDIYNRLLNLAAKSWKEENGNSAKSCK